ncbi:MAG: hypothetical protein ACKOJF_04380, partial [Planctomycetaceae bacterium]
RPHGTGFQAKVSLGPHVWLSDPSDELPTELANAWNRHLTSRPSSPLRQWADRQRDRNNREQLLRALGTALGNCLLPGRAGHYLDNLLRYPSANEWLEVRFETDVAQWLTLPFEALRLPSDKVLATQPGVGIERRPGPALLAGGRARATSGNATAPPLPAKPIKVLAVAAAPDEGRSGGAVLDLERESQLLLDMTARAERDGHCEIRSLEIGHPALIAAELGQNAYQVLHLSCHGAAGRLEFENELGHAVLTTPEAFLGELQGRTGNRLF